MSKREETKRDENEGRRAIVAISDSVTLSEGTIFVSSA